MNRLPNFLIIGAARSGTTALYEYLGQHPDVFMSEPKEPHFLAFEGAPPVFGGPDGAAVSRSVVSDLGRYRDLFAGAGARAAVGEATVAYLYYPDTIAAIRRHLPDARLIAVLRQPAERAFSAWGLQRNRMLEPLGFEEALAAEDQRVIEHWPHMWHYRRMGFYGAQLEPFFATFGRERIRVYLFEDFQQDPVRIARDAFGFLGVDPAFTPAPTSQVGRSGAPRSALLQSLMWRIVRVRKVVGAVVPKPLRRTAWRWLREKNVRRETMDPAVRARLTDLYRDDIARLGPLIGRDLGAWLLAPVTPVPDSGR